MIHVTYLSGIIPDMKKIKEISDLNNLILIEDISQAYGAHYENQLCGTF